MTRLRHVDLEAMVRTGGAVAKSDGGGLTFDVSKHGYASWILRYRYGGKPRALTLGPYPLLGLKEARIEAQKARAELLAGRDPASLRHGAKASQFAQMTLNELFDDFLSNRGPELRPATVSAHRYGYRKDVGPKIGSRLVRDLIPADIVLLLRGVKQRSYSSAKRLWENLSALFSHAVAISVIHQSPMIGLKPSSVLGRGPDRKQRVRLNLSELMTLCAALPNLGDTNRLAVLVLLATCVRKSELFEAQWSEFDLAAGIWSVPSERTGNKARRGYRIPLAAPVVQWLEELQVIANLSPYVFPAQVRSSRAKNEHISRTTLNLSLRKIEGLGVAISPHDLRATARSFLRMIGARDDVIERALNHSLGGMREPYQDDLFLERKMVLGQWARLIQDSINGSANSSEMIPIAFRQQQELPAAANETEYYMPRLDESR